MTATFIGRSKWTDVRVDVARSMDMDVHVFPAVPEEDSLAFLPRESSAIFLAVSTDRVARLSEAAVRRMTHVFLDTARPPSISDSALLVRRANEGGVEVSYSRPLWFDSRIQELAAGGMASVVAAERGMSVGPDSDWRQALHQTADLCGILCGTFATKKVDAEAVRGPNHFPLMILFTARFVNGGLAVARIGPVSDGESAVRIVAGSRSGVVAASAEASIALVERETEAFLTAVRSGKPAPVSLQAGIETTRVVEDILSRLR